MNRQWDQSPDDEQGALRNLVERGPRSVEARLMKALAGRGLVQAGPGGWVISAAGRQLYGEWILTELNAKRALERELRGR